MVRGCGFEARELGAKAASESERDRRMVHEFRPVFASVLSTLWLGIWGCSSPHQGDGASNAGAPSPPLDELLAVAVAKGAANDGVPYSAPPHVDAPVPKPPNLSGLPQDAQGRSVLIESHGVRIVINTARHDAISAKGACLHRVANCLDPATMHGASSVDACWMSTPACSSNAPWNESASPGCCPKRCSELYERLRKLGYAPLTADELTADSECFNGMRELMRQAPAGGKP